MNDEELRELEQLAKNDPRARYDYRRLCVRIGKPEKAGYEIGDLVRVKESHYIPWIIGPWTGTIITFGGIGVRVRVRPDRFDYSWKVRPTPEYFNEGLALNSHPSSDKITLLEPHNPLAQ